MRERCVYIVQAMEAAVRRVLDAEPEGLGGWMYLGERVKASDACDRWLAGVGERLSLGAELQETARDAKQDYIGYVGRLGEQLDAPEWWLSSLSEKNPYISKTFLWLCHVLTAVRLLDRTLAHRPVLVIAEQACVRQVLAFHLETMGWGVVADRRPWRSVACAKVAALVTRPLRLLWFVVINWTRLAQARLLGARRPDVWGGECGMRGPRMVLLHGWVDGRSFDGRGRYRNVNLGELGSYLERHGRSCRLVPLILPTVPYGQTVRALLRSGTRFLLPHAWLTPVDVARAALADLRWRGPHGPFPRFRSLDIGPLIDADLAQDQAVARLASNLLYAALVERWREQDLPVEGFVYSYENHLWERGFCLGFGRTFPTARLVGYQDANVPDLCLNFFFAEAERARLPSPHRVVTNGPYSIGVLRRSGYGEDRLLQGGAIRFESSVRRLDPESGQGTQDGDGEKPSPVALVIVPSSKALAAELVSKTLAALGGESDIRVIIKCHPVLPFEVIGKELGGVTLPRHIEVSTRPFGDLLPQAGVLLYMDSTTSVEALAHGLGVIHVASEWSLDLDTIGLDCEERVRVRTPGELSAAVRTLLSEAGDGLAERRKRGRSLAARFFGQTGEAAYRPVLDALAQPSADLGADTPVLSSGSGRL